MLRANNSGSRESIWHPGGIDPQIGASLPPRFYNSSSSADCENIGSQQRGSLQVIKNIANLKLRHFGRFGLINDWETSRPKISSRNSLYAANQPCTSVSEPIARREMGQHVIATPTLPFRVRANIPKNQTNIAHTFSDPERGLQFPLCEFTEPMQNYKSNKVLSSKKKAVSYAFFRLVENQSVFKYEQSFTKLSQLRLWNTNHKLSIIYNRSNNATREFQ